MQFASVIVFTFTFNLFECDLDFVLAQMTQS